MLEQPPPGSTLAHVDALRSIAGSIAAINTHDWSEEAIALERAADHLDDLAAKLISAEDIVRLNDEVSTYAANMATIREWVDWIAVESASGETSSGPRSLLDAYPGITLVQPKPCEEETPPRE